MSMHMSNVPQIVAMGYRGSDRLILNNFPHVTRHTPTDQNLVDISMRGRAIVPSLARASTNTPTQMAGLLSWRLPNQEDDSTALAGLPRRLLIIFYGIF